jgi:Flp pilus assembly protein TadD
MYIDSEHTMRATRRVLAVLATAVISSCATYDRTPELLVSQQVSTEMLLDTSPLAAGTERVDLSQIDVLELSPLMIEFLDRWIDRYQGDNPKLRRLLYAVMGDGTFNLIYDDTTRTAQETFFDQRGNCLSFTNMFIAMSRYVDLDAKFQEVIVPPDWSVVGQTFILNKHVNVHVAMDLGVDKLVDFNMADFRISYDRQIVSDSRGHAHYFNNIGVERMLDGDAPLALAYFHESIRRGKAFSPAWVNLGILYNREGYPNYAEAAYLKALDVDGSSLVAMSNLASLYEQEGRGELAAQYQSKVQSHRMQNPYYRYQLARLAFDNGDYTTAIDHLKFAVRKNRNDDSFYFLMSLSYLNSSDKKEARHWMKKAEEVAEMDEDKKRYHNKLDLLLRNDAGS